LLVRGEALFYSIPFYGVVSVMNEIGIGLAGFGTVGAGVVEGLQRHADRIAARAGVRLVLRKIADVDWERDRGVRVDPALMTRDAAALIADPSVQIVVELIGGTKAARDLVRGALDAGKPVVTANKALLAEHGTELFTLAAQRRVALGFEASVGGAIPIIRAIRDGLVANRFQRLIGILNGTCNFILTRMDREQATFDHALKDAQAAGYAEADPSLDIDGHDTAHKAVLLAGLACGVPLPFSAAHVEGIRGLSKLDIEYARELGYRIKLLAIVRLDDGDVEVRVHPTLIPSGSLLAAVNGVFNAILVEGDLAGPTLHYGRGAGRLPTASAVISDLVEVARGLAGGTAPGVPFRPQAVPPRVRPIGEAITRSYIRLSLLDRPGVLAQVASVFGQHRISIASVVQKEPHSGRHVPVVWVTHPAMDRDCAEALAEIGRLSVTSGPPIRIRIEDMEVER